MQQTLLFIPHDWFEGRLFFCWLVIGVLIFAWLLIRHGWTQESWSFLPVFGILAAIIYFVLPELEVYGVNPHDPAGPYIKVGLGIRGYGVFLLLAILSGVGIIMLRCRQAGFDPDRILTLAFWMTISGIAGARILYVVQKSDEFFGGHESLRETLVGVLDMTKGGLVVYGSLIGGMVAALVFFRVTKLSFTKAADLIAPGMMLGLAVGRIGCLMNGCCYGGVCESNLPSMQFPAGSPPYMQQLAYGDLLGMNTLQNSEKDSYARTVTSVEPDSVSSELGIKATDRVTIQTPESQRIQFLKKHPELWNDPRELVLYVDSERQGLLTVPLSKVSDHSISIHPTQVYSSINAALICLLLWFYWTVRRFDGEVFALMLILYSVGRFMLEIVRHDEAGLFGSSLTISQWVSVGTLVVGFAMMAYVRIYGVPAQVQKNGLAG